MKKKWFQETLQNKIIILDGATGTELQNYGMKAGYCPEFLNIEYPEMVKKLYKSYIDAGSMIISANTFGANRAKLEEYNLQDKIVEINEIAITLAKDLIKDNSVKVFASISSTGIMMEPIGAADFDVIYKIFREQAEILSKTDVDGIIIETMTDIKEMKAAIIAFQEITNLPIIASMTFQGDGRSVTGTDPKTAAIILDGFGLDAIGVNCSVGPERLYDFVKDISSFCSTNLFVQSNAGLPKLIGNKTVFDASPEYMLDYYKKYNDLGVNIFGGCCGTTPNHIKVFADYFKDKSPIKRNIDEYLNFSYFASRSSYARIGNPEIVKMLGERINPNALKRIKEDIMEYKTLNIRKEAVAQVEAGATMLDVNVGVGTIDEAIMMKKAILAVENVVNVPLSIDTTDLHALEEGLKAYSGKAFVNSVMGKEESLHKVLPIVKKYGAGVLGLTLDEDGIPDNAERRFQIAEKIVNTAISYGIKKKDIFIDTLVLTASAEQKTVMETVKTIQLVKDKLGVNTTLGLSNISFGLPNRNSINTAFLSMCIAAGLDMPIINPMSNEIKNTILAASVLTNRDKNAEKYIEFNLKNSNISSSTTSKLPEIDLTEDEKLYNAILYGQVEDIEVIISNYDKTSNKTPLKIINEILIPAITEVGDLYEKGVYFLPQLIMSADTMKKAVSILNAKIDHSTIESIGKIVIATVKNDIHDIGKNIVSVLLENNGFEIIDLGKDVSQEEILKIAIESNADIVALSALMTTTMLEMKKTINLLRDNNININIMVGGAVVTPEFANEMGVFYSKDAVGAVKMAKHIIENR